MDSYNLIEQDNSDLIDIVLNSKPIYFEVDELKEIQSGDNPFTYNEIINLLYEEMKRPAEEVNYSAVEFYLNILFD